MTTYVAHRLSLLESINSAKNYENGMNMQKNGGNFSEDESNGLTSNGSSNSSSSSSSSNSSSSHDSHDHGIKKDVDQDHVFNSVHIEDGNASKDGGGSSCKDHAVEIVDFTYVLAGLYVSQGSNTEALQLYEIVFERREKLLGSDHPSTLDSLDCVAGVLQSLGKYDAARSLFERCLEVRKVVLGDR